MRKYLSHLRIYRIFRISLPHLLHRYHLPRSFLYLRFDEVIVRITRNNVQPKFGSFPHEIHSRAIAKFEESFEIIAIPSAKHFPREPQFRTRKKSDSKHARNGEE